MIWFQVFLSNISNLNIYSFVQKEVSERRFLMFLIFKVSSKHRFMQAHHLPYFQDQEAGNIALEIMLWLKIFLRSTKITKS